MPRPKAAVPKALLKAWIPMEVRAKLDLMLFSDLEQRVPQGEYSKLIEQLLKQHMDWGVLDLSLYGFPAGYFVRGPKAMLQPLEDKLSVAPARNCLRAMTDGRCSFPQCACK